MRFLKLYGLYLVGAFFVWHFLKPKPNTGEFVLPGKDMKIDGKKLSDFLPPSLQQT
jgi:hypothetical protein